MGNKLIFLFYIRTNGFVFTKRLDWRILTKQQDDARLVQVLTIHSMTNSRFLI